MNKGDALELLRQSLMPSQCDSSLIRTGTKDMMVVERCI